MFERLLVPVDPVESDDVVFEYGLTVAGQFDAEVHVLSVIEGAQQRDQLRTDREEEAAETVDRLVEEAEGHNLRASGEVRLGSAHEEILSSIGDSAIDLVVMGTQARSGVNRLLLGSVAEEVIRESPVPVMTITPEASPAVHT